MTTLKNVLSRRDLVQTYRESFGLDNPPKGEALEIKHIEGLKFYIVWPNCPDLENVIEGWFNTEALARKYVLENGWSAL